MNCQQIIENIFPKLIIRKPLFYSWNIGLRFELNSNFKGKIFGTDYFKNSFKRAKTIYEECFDPLDEVLVIYQEYIGLNYRKFDKKNFCFQNINSLKNIQYNKIKGLYDDDDDDEYYIEALFITKAKNINHSEILTAISNMDFYDRKPQINGATFFLNISKELVFHMYDDRGLDIISKEKNTLRKLYKKYNSRILDYDRKKIDKIFKIKI